MANKMADEVVMNAIRNQISPITVVVLDAAAHVIVQKRMDNCPPVGPSSFAYSKAYTCVAMKCSSRAFRDKYTTFPEGEFPDAKKFSQVISMSTIVEGKIAPFPGGVLLKARETGEIVGAIGVSGATSDEDEAVALAGAKLFSDLIASDPA